MTFIEKQLLIGDQLWWKTTINETDNIPLCGIICQLC